MRASLGGRGGVRPPPRGSGAQDPRPTEDPALPAHAGQPGLSADGNGHLLGRGDPGSALVREVAGTAGGPVCRAPLRWGSDLAPCPPHRLGTPRLPRRTPSRCQWILGGRPRELPAQEGTQCPAPPGALGPCSAPPGWAGAQQHLQGKQAAPRSTFLRQPGQRRLRAPASRAGPGLTPWPWVPRDGTPFQPGGPSLRRARARARAAPSSEAKIAAII